MKILCGYSSIEFNCDHFPGSLTSRETYHPVFNLPQKKLLAYLGKWAGNELTTIDSYLLFLALLNSSDLVDFRVPAIRTEQTDSIIAQNLEELAKTVIKLNTVSSPSAIFPRYVISPETKALENVKYWITNWKDSYSDFLSGYKSAHDSQKLITREAALSRLIKNPHRSISTYAAQIADWAAIAGNFPVFIMISPFTGLKLTCADYWKQLIIKCVKKESLISSTTKQLKRDLAELLEHCEDVISGNGIFSHALFTALKDGRERQENYLGLGDIDISKGSYEILSSTDSVEDANIRAMIQSAPSEEPKREQYPNGLAFLKAKNRWNLQKKYGSSGPGGSTE